MKRKIKKKERIELTNEELSLLLEALKYQVKRVREDMFYRNEHPREFYEIYLRRYFDLMNKIDYKIPKTVMLPKF